MSTVESDRLSEVWQEIREWPPHLRLWLASRVLQSLEAALPPSAPVSPERKQALADLIGLWKTDHPPTDDEVEQILEQERMRKYG